jgi:hypothetical protein
MPPHNQRDAYLAGCAAAFARDLEGVLKRDPLQWYNFFPFWQEPTHSSQRGTAGGRDSLRASPSSTTSSQTL